MPAQQKETRERGSQSTVIDYMTMGRLKCGCGHLLDSHGEIGCHAFLGIGKKVCACKVAIKLPPHCDRLY